MSNHYTHKDSMVIPSPYLNHVKSPSKSSTVANGRFSPVYPPPKSSLRLISRSASSPNIPAQNFEDYKHHDSNRDSLEYEMNDNESPLLPSYHPITFQVPESYSLSGRKDICPNKDLSSCSSSSFSQNRRRESVASSSKVSASSHRKSLTSVIDNFLDFHESEYDTPDLSQPKRSHSPMKKMFGENGWLGQSPNDFQTRNSRQTSKSSWSKETTSMMGKLRNKIGELAEKADLSPSPSSRGSRRSKQDKISVLSISLGPSVQAKIYMEIELMLVYTANAFLMKNFSQGRMSVDSIKQTVDAWRSKGRPVVFEFMYDQATQRELVKINQHNFCFHGRGGDDALRVNSMLYNWKYVAGVMAIRTFCDANTVILKLLFDVEQVLELLGAQDTIMQRLHQIRIAVSELIHSSRQARNVTSMRRSEP
ncbi:hypothetical protein BGHDH14_bgh00412 [Blumeria hordei DH14]|uniref:Uncharacterized protein n=1 Tax=Blumeria graminis f. sp. hordei (strain DH14) TaxID=546991 RepID=N1JNP2_BLUG1|nr:hypothetical protein BGHDH14_bgh00412 [Blumeria hordei DH14]